MSPFKGQGANQAILDAVSLTKALRRSQVGFGDTVVCTTLARDREEGEREGETFIDLGDSKVKVEVAFPGLALASSLHSFETEMATRSRVKVLKSREAAKYLHSQSAMTRGDITRAMAAELSQEKEEALAMARREGEGEL